MDTMSFKDVHANLPQEVTPSERILPMHSGPQAEPARRTRWEAWSLRIKLVAAISLPVVLETLDYTIVASSQPNIASIFNRLDLQSYIGTAYVLGSTVSLPIFASLADVFGRYWAMQVSVVIFIIGSALSTGANSMELLIAGRAIAGVGAAGLLTLVRIVLSDSASLDDNNAQTAMLVIVYTLGYSVGPSIGGSLYKVGWRWIFGINLPICAVAVVIMALVLPKISKGPQPSQRLKRLPPTLRSDLQSRLDSSIFSNMLRLDLVGALLFIVLGILILLALNWGSTEEWTQVRVIVCFAVGGFLLLVFVAWEYIVDHSTDALVHTEVYPLTDVELSASPATSRRNSEEFPFQRSTPLGKRVRLAQRIAPSFVQVTDPMIPMNMFRSYDVVATNIATLASGMVMLGMFYFVAVFFVVVKEKDSVASGAQLLYFAPGMGIGAVQ